VSVRGDSYPFVSGLRKLLVVSRISESLFKNYPGMLFSSKRPDGEARMLPHWHQRISLVDLRLRGNKARRPFAENPPGGGSFARGQRWLGRYSPLRGCSDLAALATAKILRRSTPRSFQTGSERDFAMRKIILRVAGCVTKPKTGWITPVLTQTESDGAQRSARPTFPVDSISDSIHIKELWRFNHGGLVKGCPTPQDPG
jgi:hypothetical protein